MCRGFDSETGSSIKFDYGAGKNRESGEQSQQDNYKWEGEGGLGVMGEGGGRDFMRLSYK